MSTNLELACKENRSPQEASTSFYLRAVSIHTLCFTMHTKKKWEHVNLNIFFLKYYVAALCNNLLNTRNVLELEMRIMMLLRFRINYLGLSAIHIYFIGIT